MAEIRFVNVSKVYDEDIIALERASFDIGQGEFLFFIGRNGAGKSTALKLLTGQETVTGGEVYMNGSSVSALNKKTAALLQKTIRHHETGSGTFTEQKHPG